MKNLDVYVSSAVCLNSLVPPYSVSTDCTPTPISAEAAEEILRMQRSLRGVFERANTQTLDHQSGSSDYFKQVVANSGAVGLLVADFNLRLKESPLPPDSPCIEANLQAYGDNSLLDARDMLFRETEWIGGCGTCFLIKPKHVLTTWHTFCNDSGAGLALSRGELCVVFDYGFDGTGRPRSVFSKEKSVFRIKAKTLNCPPSEEWITLELEEEAADGIHRKYLSRSEDVISPDTPVYSLGHPNKVSQRYCKTCLPLEIETGHFYGFLEAYDGSSGSPVFSAKDHGVVGMVNKSTQPTGKVRVGVEFRYVSQLCLPGYARRPTLCIDSVAFKSEF